MTTATALHSPLMDEAESTQAADVPDSETQSLHAWSQADDADTELAATPHRRSWRLPIALAAVAAAAVTAGAVFAWPQHHVAPAHPTPAPTAAPTPIPHVPTPAPPKPESKDDLYVRLLTEHGISPGPADVVGAEGRGICRRLSTGRTEQQMARDVMAGTPGISENDAWIWVDTAVEVYCP